MATTLVQLAKAHLNCDQAGIAIRRPSESPPTLTTAAGVTSSVQARTLSTLASTDAMVERSDHLQNTLGHGPSLPAWQGEPVVVVTDLATDPRWPRWGQALAQLGIRGLIAVRLTSGPRELGVLSLYTTTQRAHHHHDLDQARLLAQQATSALAAGSEIRHLHQAMETRTTIGQAKGILMERFGVSADSAMAVLRRISQDSNRKLNTIAAEIVSTRHLPATRRDPEDWKSPGQPHHRHAAHEPPSSANESPRQGAL